MFYFILFVLILHLGTLLKIQDFAILDTVPTLEKKRTVLSQIFMIWVQSKSVWLQTYQGYKITNR